MRTMNRKPMINVPTTEQLLPAVFCQDDGFTVNELQALQAAADADGLLLPTHFNVNLSPRPAAGGHDTEALLPPGVV